MRFEIQRADTWKRISAFLFDVIMLMIVAVGFAAILSAVLNYDSHVEKYDAIKTEYYEKYNIDLETPEDQLTQEQKQAREDANKAFEEDTRAIFEYNMLINLALIIISFSILISYLILEVTLPHFMKYGRTMGKRVFGLAVIRTNGVRADGVAFFIRTIIGKYVMETMVPIYLIIMTLFSDAGIIGPVVILLIVALEIFTVFYTKTRSMIHDLVSDTVVVDYASQMIFETEDDLVQYKTRIHEEIANKQEY